MTSKIELEGMRFYAFHGVSPQERTVGNSFVVTLSLTVPVQAAVESDELAHTVNYAEVYESVNEEMKIPSRLLEHVAGRILYALKKRFPQVTTACIKVSKQAPPFGGEVRSASVILEECWA
ncbi:MAG: dihydroneopterin aldolase [Parabacteroides sp.]|nr:dihydroneopterin aldolase [Parabacteroides sp.]